MMPYWRNFQSLLILRINFIQFLELTLVHKFMLSSMTLNNDIYFVVIVFLQYFFLPLLSSSITIKFYQLYFNNKRVI